MSAGREAATGRSFAALAKATRQRGKALGWSEATIGSAIAAHARKLRAPSFSLSPVVLAILLLLVLTSTRQSEGVSGLPSAKAKLRRGRHKAGNPPDGDMPSWYLGNPPDGDMPGGL